MEYRCSQCGNELERDQVWIPDDMDDKRVYCYHHAPDDAIRLKDTMGARQPREYRMREEAPNG